MTDLVTQSMELAAETAGDFTPMVYDKYFAACPGSEELMSHIDDLVRGKMMVEVYRLMMLDNFEDEAGYLNFEVDNHELAYSVKPNMYDNLLQALKETIADSLGDQWNPDYAQAWDGRIHTLTSEITSRLRKK